MALSTDDIKDGIETRNHGNYEKNIYFNEEDKYISVVELIYIKLRTYRIELTKQKKKYLKKTKAFFLLSIFSWDESGSSI